MFVGHWGEFRIMSQSLFFSLMTPSRGSGEILQSALLMVLALLMIFGVDLVGDGRLHGVTLVYVAEVLVVAVPMVFLARVISAQLRKLQQKLDAVESRDALTGTYNRAAFEEHVTQALPQNGALLVLDVDHLKVINQRLGHDAGDLCLMGLAMKFREVTRATDIIGRLDGATFAIYMPGAPTDIAAMIADRLRDGIQVTTAQGLLHVTVSVGAVVADGLTPLDKLMREASAALARAKMAGRGRVILRNLPAAA